jgi:RNA polymerase sigma factor (sigma-70 family)
MASADFKTTKFKEVNMTNYKLKNEYGRPTKVEIEVEAGDAEVLIQIDRKTEANNRKFSRREKNTASIDYLLDEYDLELADEDANPERQFIEAEDAAEREAQLAKLPDALAALSDKHRLIVTLYYIEEKTLRQIADEISGDFSNVRKQLETALKHLKKFFENS